MSLPQPVRAQSRLHRALALIAAAALVAAPALVLTPQAGAEIDPPPNDNTAAVNVSVGAERTGVNGVTALPDVQLGLFTTETGPTQAAPPCTSDADGDCTFQVPNTGAGQSNRGNRFWVRQISVPGGYFTNPSLRTGSSSAAQTQETLYRFQTPQLYGGQTYRSGFQFMAGTGNTTRNVSGGVWQQSRNNPTLPTSCGLDVALILDISGSVGSALPDLKQAARTFTDALVGTPSRMSLFSFSNNSPASGGANYPGLTSVSTQAQANAFKARFANWTSGGGTNWDRGIAVAAAASDQFDIAVMITDGNPTLENDPPTGPTSFNRLKEVEAGIFSANQLKSQGSRLLVFGVGDGAQGDITALNLRSISGNVKFNGSNQNTADYYQTDDYGAVGSALRSLALGNCAGSISVTKQIVPSGNTGDDISGAQPAGPGWEFTASSTTVGVIDPDVRETTDDGTGTVNFPLDFPGGVNAGDVTVVETQQIGYTLVTPGGQNAVCTRPGPEADPTAIPVPVTNTPGQPGFTVDVPRTAPISCTVYNRPPVPAADVVVDKQWVINGTEYDEGAQPEDFEATLSLSGPADAPASDQEWGVPRPGYSAGNAVTISEDVTLPPDDLCSVEASIEGNNNPPAPGADVPYTATLGAGTNAYVITNVVTCTAELTLVKDVVNGTAPATDWTLTATGPDGSLAGPTGQTGTPATTDVEVTPGVSYELSESGDTLATTNYEQVDVDLDPTTRPWLCQLVTGPDRDVVFRFSDGIDGNVTVPPGRRVDCYAFNWTANLELRKLVENRYGGDAEAADWQLTATPVGDVPPGVVAQTVTGSADYQSLEVYPGVTYEISETGPDGYRQVGITCDIVTDNPDGDPPPTTNGRIAVPELETARCTVTNRDDPARLTLVKEVAGGAREPAEWTLTAAGPTDLSGVSGAPAVTQAAVAPGRYELGETGPTDYAPSAWDCQNGTEAPFTTTGALDLARGDDVRCVITNTFVPPANRARLTLVKEVDNTGGGSADATDWTLTADGPVTFSGETGDETVTQVEVPAGTYELSEAGGPGAYTASDWDCQNRTETPVTTSGRIDVAAGSDVTCVITNRYAGVGPIPPKPPLPPLPPTGGPGFWPLAAGLGLVVLAGILLLVSRLTRARAGRRGH